MHSQYMKNSWEPDFKNLKMMNESSKHHPKLLSLIFILTCLSRASVIRIYEKIKYLYCGERYEDAIDPRSYAHNLSSYEIFGGGGGEAEVWVIWYRHEFFYRLDIFSLRVTCFFPPR